MATPVVFDSPARDFLGRAISTFAVGKSIRRGRAVQILICTRKCFNFFSSPRRVRLPTHIDGGNQSGSPERKHFLCKVVPVLIG